VYTPAIMLEYRTKCRDYMLSTGQEDLNFRTDRLDIDEVYHTLTLLYENLKIYQARLSVQIQHWKSQLREAASEAVSSVSETSEIAVGRTFMSGSAKQYSIMRERFPTPGNS